jgi:hypothetical protein
MPTVLEPKDVKPQPVTSATKEPELFAAEIAMEEKSSSFLPLLFIAALVLVVGGAIVYFVRGANAKLTPEVATTTVNTILKAQPPAVIKFSTGTLVSSVNEKPMDPHYKLLAKLGILTIKPKAWNSIYSTMNPAGEKLLSTINGVEKGTNKKDNTVTYVVPLAERKLLAINDIKMLNPHMAQVDYTWQWVPNRLGRDFDATGDVVKGFNTWDRQTLINTYGVNFYTATPTKVRIVLMQTKDDSWKPYVE